MLDLCPTDGWSARLNRGMHDSRLHPVSLGKQEPYLLYSLCESTSAQVEVGVHPQIQHPLIHLHPDISVPHPEAVIRFSVHF
jgi:hypothetical protein